jgi:hypothetical protein
MSGLTGRDGSTLRARDRRRVRWPALGTALVLGLLLALTTTLERSAPLGSSTPAVTGLAPPLLDAPVRCPRPDPPERLAELRAALRPDGRLTSAIATACPRLLDGQDVHYVGEVVGDVLRRDGGAWVQVNDDAYALEVGPFGPHRTRRGFSSGLAVWLPDGLHEQLGMPGRHGSRGAIVRIEGTLLRADPADGGGLNVRADRLEVLSPPVTVEEPLNRPLILSAAVAALLAFGAWVWARRQGRSRAR